MQRTKPRSMANRREAENNHFWAVWIFFIVSIMCGLGNCAPRKCLHGKTYLDKFTHRRECCAGICEHATIWRTEEDCKNKCPDYSEPKPAEMIDKMIDKQEDDPLNDTPPTKPGYTTFITVLITALVVIVVVVILVVLALYAKRGSCARVLPGDQEQRNHNDDGRFEMNHIEQRRQENGNRPVRGPLGNDEANVNLLPHHNGNLYDRGYGQMNGRRDDQMANRQPLLVNGFNGTVTEAHQQNGGLGRVHQQPGDVDARRWDQDRATAAAREAQPLRRPINETGDHAPAEVVVN